MNATIEPPLATVQTDAPLNGAKTLRPPATAEQRQQVISLHQQRKTKREIEAITGLSWSQVDLILQKFKTSLKDFSHDGQGNDTTPAVQPPEIPVNEVDSADTTGNGNKPAGPIQVTEELKNRAFDMFHAGKTKGDVCRALKMSISQVRNIKRIFNAKKPVVLWDTPEDWVEGQAGVLEQSKVKDKAGNAPIWFLIQALYMGGSRLDGILPFCGDEEELVTPNLTRRQWFQEVSKLVIGKGNLRDSIEKQWGQIIKVTRTDKYDTKQLQAPPYGAYLLHQLNLRYIPNEKSFYRYFPEGQGHEKEGTWEFVTTTEVERDIMEWAVKREIDGVSPEKKQYSEAMSYMRPLGLFEQHNFSTNPLHVKNGMLFFEEEELIPVNPAYFSRAKLPVKHDATVGANPKRFLQFLDEASLLEEDQDLLQLWCGFVLLGDNSVHKIMMFTGDAGSGKSTLIELLEKMLGHESIATLNIERLDDRFELGSFFDRRLLVAKDVSADALNSQAAYMLKALSGDSLIKAEIKHQNRRVSLKGPFNIAITSNSNLFIKLHGDADAWHRRLIIIKFRKKPNLVVENKLSEKMFEKEGSAILNWMIKGAIRARAVLDEKDKFPKSAEQNQRVNELLRLSDSVKAFVAENLQSEAKGTITTQDLYQAYENYCACNRVVPVPRGAFEREIVMRIQEKWGGKKSMIKDPATGSPCRGYFGISFKSMATPPTAAAPATPPVSAPTVPATAPTAKPPADATTPATQAPPIQAVSTSSPTEQTPSDDVPY